MPQTTGERAERWPSDNYAMDFLKRRKWQLTKQWEWYHPFYSESDNYYMIPHDQWDAILFLIEEWDFGSVTNVKPDA